MTRLTEAPTNEPPSPRDFAREAALQRVGHPLQMVDQAPQKADRAPQVQERVESAQVAEPGG
jgi:hypothetical protein